jgi:ribokinase
MKTTFIGALGTDSMAAQASTLLEQAGVDLNWLQHLPGQTGCAGIVVDSNGENQIVVAPGANQSLRAAHVPDSVLAGADALLLQMETEPLENAALAERAKQHGCLVVLNNAPAQPLQPELMRVVDVLIMNQHELAVTANALEIKDGDATDQLQLLAERFSLTSVLTLGERGVVACKPNASPVTLPASHVQVVDTTGAGDTFAGVFTAALVKGSTLEDALARGVVAAGLSCSQHGAQIAQPLRDETDLALAAYRR